MTGYLNRASMRKGVQMAAVERLQARRVNCRLQSTVLNEQKQISVTGVFTGRGDHCVSLPAMMRLMIEEMCDQNTTW